MSTLKWVLPFTPRSTTVARCCSAGQASAVSLQSSLTPAHLPSLPQIPTWANHSSSFPKVSVSSHPSSPDSVQPLHESSGKAAHSESLFQHPSLMLLCFTHCYESSGTILQPRVYRFFTVSLTSQCVSSNWSCRNETFTFSGRLPRYTMLRLHWATEPVGWMKTYLHI